MNLIPQEADAICSAELLDVRRRLENTFGPDAVDTENSLVGRWTLAADASGQRGGELVLDPHNRRLKLYGLKASECRDPGVKCWYDGLKTAAPLYSKLIVYARPDEPMSWITAGYLNEGIIEGFFADGGDAHMWAAFGNEERSDAPRDGRHDEIVQIAAAKPIIIPEPAVGFVCLRAKPEHADSIAKLMTATFAEYPTPINAKLIEEQIVSGSYVFRYMVDPAGELVASASAEIDHQRSCAELTDCATRPDQRGAGHMGVLLDRLAQDVGRDLGITNLYTLARADEVGMNCVFGKLGFRYTGRLINNCRMPNGWESMNIWCANSEPGADADGAHQ